jgi:hypothetical protein
MSSASPQQFELGFNDGTLAIFAGAILLLGGVVWSAHLAGIERTDFSLTYVGASIVHHGEGAHLYDTNLQRETRDSLFAHRSPLFFEHPPFEALLLSPLASLPFRTAYTLWGLLNAAVLLLLMIFLRPYLPWPRELLGYMFLWLLFAPLAVTLYQGQSSIILLALFSAVFVFFKNQREWPAGFLLGFGLIKFQFVLPFLFIVFLIRKWRFLAGFLISTCILGLLSFVAVGLQGMEQYFRFVMAIASNPQNQSYGSAVDMPTLHGFLYAIFGQRIGYSSLNIATALSSVLLLIWVAIRWNSAKSDTSKELMFAATVASSLVTSGHMFTHDFSPLILSLFVAGSHFRDAASSSRIRLALTLAIFWSFPVYFLAVAWHCLYIMCPVLLVFVFAVLELANSESRRAALQLGYVRA